MTGVANVELEVRSVDSAIVVLWMVGGRGVSMGRLITKANSERLRVSMRCHRIKSEVRKWKYGAFKRLRTITLCVVQFIFQHSQFLALPCQVLLHALVPSY